MSKNKYITKVVSVNLDDIIGNNLEGFIDLIAEYTGYPCLEDISYKAVGVGEDGYILIEVTGDPSNAEYDEESDKAGKPLLDW